MSTGSMSRRPRSFTRFTFTVLAEASVGVVLIVLAATGALGGSSTAGQVKLHLPAARTPAGGTQNAQQYSFDAPSSTPDSVPPPPGESSLVTTVGTKTTQRIQTQTPAHGRLAHAGYLSTLDGEEHAARTYAGQLACIRRDLS